jgi:hypothetical protein
LRVAAVVVAMAEAVVAMAEAVAGFMVLEVFTEAGAHSMAEVDFTALLRTVVLTALLATRRTDPVSLATRRMVLVSPLTPVMGADLNMALPPTNLATDLPVTALVAINSRLGIFMD